MAPKLQCHVLRLVLSADRHRELLTGLLRLRLELHAPVTERFRRPVVGSNVCKPHDPADVSLPISSRKLRHRISYSRTLPRSLFMICIVLVVDFCEFEF